MSENRLAQAFINKEFLLFCLPSYLICVASAARLYYFHQQQKDQLELTLETPLFSEKKPIPISLQIKLRITIWIGSLYCLTFLLSFFGALVNFEAQTEYCYNYILMIIGQVMSYILLLKEHQMNEAQGITTHRLFWPFQASFFFIRLLQPYMTFQFFLINIAQLIPSLLLLLYGLYKPDDNHDIINDDSVPTFAQEIFIFVEQYAKRFFKQPSIEHKSAVIEMQPVSHDEETFNELRKILDEKVRRSSVHGQEQFMVDKLPKRAVVVSKKVIKKFEEDNKALYYYQCITQIGQEHFIAEQRYPDFVNLENRLVNLLGNDIPKIKKIELNQNEDEQQFIQRRADVLENWLKQIIAQPKFMVEILMTFLNIDHQSQSVFIAYHDLTSSKQPSKIVKTLVRNSSVMLETVTPKKDTLEQYISDNMEQLRFTASCSSYEYGILGSNSQEFVIIITYNDTYIYRILRTLSSIKQFAKQMEGTLGRTLPIPQTLNTNQAKIQFVDQFFNMLMENQEFYCPLLFDYIGFDVRKRQEV